MGKKGRKTRWRTLTITDEHSDSEESNTTTSGHRVSKGYPQKSSYYGRFTYSSQSTPTRRYQCDGTKSTRSSSTASENKITFNEDEYTRITTPRQDVLFKKGYLNKPKTYQTQTSTGNSTTSTGNSTGNGTPDHQSTDLEYESQFVFPNGFVDQNGIYYVNSFEPYPLMVFNPPTYYTDFNSVKSKRCSTGSLTESTSPNNEEASQDLSQSETPNNVSDINHVYNVIYPGFYFNGACQPRDVANHHQPWMKKKRRRKLSRSKSVQEATTSEYTDESSDEVFSDHNQENTKELSEETQQQQQTDEEEEKVDSQKLLMNGLTKETSEPQPEEEEEEGEKNQDPEEQKKEEEKEEEAPKPKYDLKPDAEEFVPRAYRQPDTIPMEATNVQFIKIPSNFVPLPILNPLDGFSGQNFNAFIPPGIPINFIPHHVNFIPNYVNKETLQQQQQQQQQTQRPNEKVEDEEKTTTTTTTTTTNETTVEVPKNQIDIARIVSKLEEAAKEQEEEEPESEEKRRPVKKPLSQKEDEKSSLAPSPKKEPPPIPRTVRNYSDTLKKSQAPPQIPCDRHDKHIDRQKLNKATPKEVVVKNHVKVESPVVKTPNQWISVSNRKKRKNKNIEETEDFEEEVLEDSIEEVTATIPSSPPTPPPPPEETPIVKIVPEEVKPIKLEEIIPVVEAKEEPKEEKREKIKTAPKKKSKKINNNQKSVTKRVIIKDMDLTQPEPEKTVNEEKIIEEMIVKQPEIKVEEIVVEDKEKPVELVVEDKLEEVVIEENLLLEEDKRESTPEKKSKKKKKKIFKAPVLSSQSSLSSTLNVAEDSYDFLLEESSREKTNVEVSQELDKMIQRGMYSSLEEKIKSLNIESSDNFFKTIITNISRESSVEKNNFGKILNTSTLLKSKSSSMELKKLGDFLDEGTPKPQTSAGGETKNKDEEQYPITKAVKEWMTKTRENTPDVEIFKSPSTILRELNLEDKNGMEEDLLEYWEDPLVEKKTTSSSVEEGEDVLEEYESKYAKNEDYLRIKREVEESKGSYPKHGNLPYRAICCSIM